MKVLNWKPKRKGLHKDIYCSSACGGNCTYKAYKQAIKKSKELAKDLGKDFKPKVWENLGWHYSAVRGDDLIQVHPPKIPGLGYTAIVAGQFTATAQMPKMALKTALHDCLKEQKRLESILNDVGVKRAVDAPE